MKESSRQFEKLYQERMKQFVLPQKLQGQYEVLECLKSGEESWAVLVRHCLTGSLCVLKEGRGICGELLKREYEVLKKLDDEGLRGIPKPYFLMEEEESRYFMREYVEGKSLCELYQEKEFTPEEIRRIGIELCDIVSQMHKLEVPVLHRDIKPENVVVMRNGSCVLIDFGTARYYRKDEARDTLVLGTEGTAAPEQYGYAQTDVRTDVYAIGQTLCYLLTGSYDLGEYRRFYNDCRLYGVLKKASSFDPQKRYKTVDKMKTALQNRGKHRNTCFLLSVTFLAALILGLRIGGYEKRQSDGGYGKDAVYQEDRNSKKINFQEPLVERAVRQSLGITEKTELTEELLEKVTELQIVGNRILTSDDETEIRNGLYVNGEWISEEERGEIQELKDFGYLKNLKNLVLCGQNLDDLSYLKNLPLERLILYDDDIVDMSGLGSLVRLQELSIGGNPCTDLTALRECIRLKKLNLDQMEIKNLDFLEILDLEELSILETRIAEGGIGKLISQENLRKLRKNNLKEEELVILKQLKKLQNLYCYSGYEPGNLEALKGIERLEFLVLMEGLVSLEGIENLPGLKYLHVQGSSVTDLTPVSDAENLLHLGIQYLNIRDYGPAANHPGLEEIFCDEEQMKEIQKENPDTKVIFHVQDN